MKHIRKFNEELGIDNIQPLQSKEELISDLTYIMEHNIDELDYDSYVRAAEAILARYKLTKIEK